jgi:hydrogenase maturation protease
MRNRFGEPPMIEFVDGGTLSFTLAEPISRADGLIVVDAARMGTPPGSVRLFRNQEMDGYLSGNRRSVHEVSLIDLLDIARLSEQLPKERVLVGIEPADMAWGESPSAQLQPAIGEAIEMILSILAQWNVSPASSE